LKDEALVKTCIYADNHQGRDEAKSIRKNDYTVCSVDENNLRNRRGSSVWLPEYLSHRQGDHTGPPLDYENSDYWLFLPFTELRLLCPFLGCSFFWW